MLRRATSQRLAEPVSRLATVIIAVLLTIFKDKIRKPLPSEEEEVQDAAELPTVGDKRTRLHPGAM